MAISQKLALRQSQSLVMTPQLTQSIKLLAMNNVELSTFVDEELERNPFLERDQRPDGAPKEQREAPQENTPETDLAREVNADNQLETSAQALSENLGTSIENVFPDEQDYVHADDKQVTRQNDDAFLSSGGLSVSNVASAHDRSVADFSPQLLSLRDHLNAQLQMSTASIEVSKITAGLIDQLDEAGYLRSDLSAIADRLGATLSAVNEALSLLQSMEPTGVGARDLGECLALQLKEKNRLDPAMQIIVDNLDLLAKRDFAALRLATELDDVDLQEAFEEIKALDPKPGTAFENVVIQHIAPDVFVSEAQDGSWHIELNSESLPRVLVNETYATSVSSQLSSSNDKEFLQGCLQTASWLTKSLDQRARTILKVATEIVKKQDAFMVHGVQHLKPLTLKEVADEIDMHESSVSRVTSNKYIMTPRGLFELKYFFTTALQSTAGGEAHSAEAVRDQIKQLIDAEPVENILSDDALVAALNASGIDIARRTVAKYREAMHIPSSVQRRREKRAAKKAADQSRSLTVS